MIALIQQLFGGSGEIGKLSLAVTLEHVELSEKHLVLGLGIDWYNPTHDPIPIKEIQVRVYLDGWSKEPLRFYPLERFARVDNQRAIQKKPVRAFTLPPKETHTQQIRFLSQKILDIPPGKYRLEVHLKDTSDLSYMNQTNIEVLSKSKYRRSEEWVAH